MTILVLSSLPPGSVGFSSRAAGSLVLTPSTTGVTTTRFTQLPLLVGRKVIVTSSAGASLTLSPR